MLIINANFARKKSENNKRLRANLNGQIEGLHADMQKMKDCHTREMNRANEQHQQEVNNLKRILEKAYQWFPSFKRFLNMECECLQYGFSEEQTDKLMHGHTINFSGWLHSNEYRRNALATNVTAQIVRDDRTLVLQINNTSISQWYRMQFGIGQEKHRGLKM